MLIFLGLAETESWRVEMYQSCASHLGLDNKIKQMMGFESQNVLNPSYGFGAADE